MEEWEYIAMALLEEKLMKKIKLALTLMAFSVGLSGQKINIEPDIRMLALGDSYTIGESVEEYQRWPSNLLSH